ncbi:MAG: ATP-grasp domain-containing protein [Dorea sp.]
MLYVGADSYTQMLCNDKYLSKKYISDFGIATPEGILIRNDRDITLIQNLALPLIVKPNFGGGSNGISNNNLVYSYEEAQKLIVTLLEYQHLPVLVEEFIPGYEVEFIIFGNKKEIFLSSEIQIEVDGISYFDHQIWGYEAKKAGLHKNKLYPANHTPSEDIPKLHALFQSFDKAEIMRVDCRINDNKLYILELSPDCYLGPTGGVAAAFRQHGSGYSEMFQKLIDNTLQSCIS